MGISLRIYFDGKYQARLRLARALYHSVNVSYKMQKVTLVSCGIFGLRHIKPV